MKFNNYLLNENMVDKALSLVKRMDFRKAKSFFKSEFDKFVETIQGAGLELEVVSVINKGLKTNYRNFKDMERQKLRESDEVLNEDLAHWWDVVKTEAFPTLAFYPGLTVWLEIDKLVQGQDINITKTIVYSIFWILLISGKYVKGWHTWKKQNPEEYAQERAAGKGGIV